uniref:Uncharacterized protein n=1 Tax=Cacopsylla melanoneura TaxID=428564 RepID=A0A8D8S4V1_9HEMI
MMLNTSRGTKLVECALGDARKHFNHRVGAVLLVHLSELEYVSTVGEEGTAQECVNHDHVTNHVEKVEELAEEVACSVHIVHVQRFNNILNKPFLTVLTIFLGGDDGTSHTV